MSTDRKFWVGLCLFAMLGGALNAIGIGVTDEPFSFFTILGPAMLIDLNASFK